MMVSTTTIFEQYVKLRRAHYSATQALEQLRTEVSRLPALERMSLVSDVQNWEHAQKDRRTIHSTARLAGKVVCVHCGATCRMDDRLCADCRWPLHFLAAETGAPLPVYPLQPDVDPAFYGPQSLLLLVLKESGSTFQLQPQTHTRSLLVGRSSDLFANMPDVDLLGHHGAQRGISRAHMSVQYDPAHERLVIADLDSRNGTWLNGERLESRATAILRHGDEILLSKLSLLVLFQHRWTAQS
jgi:hypothetical protein